MLDERCEFDDLAVVRVSLIVTRMISEDIQRWVRTDHFQDFVDVWDIPYEACQVHAANKIAACQDLKQRFL